MDTVCEWEMAVGIRKAGGIGTLHRYMSIEEQARHVKMAKANKSIVGGSVGAIGQFETMLQCLLEAGAIFILIDIANGHSDHAVEATKDCAECWAVTFTSWLVMFLLGKDMLG
jgi:IMP dehydrogenase